MPKNESYYTRLLCDAFVRIGGKVDAIVGSRMNKTGRPDRYWCHIEWHGWLEMKMEERQLSPEQLDWYLEQNKRQPGTCVIVRFFPRQDKIDITTCYSRAGIVKTAIFPLTPVLKNPENTREFLACLRAFHCQLAKALSDATAYTDAGVTGS